MTDAYNQATETILTELLDGAPKSGGFVLNPGDAGLLASLDRLTFAQAQQVVTHVDHLRYGFEVLNRWQAGQDDAFATADYGPSWHKTLKTEVEWSELRKALRNETSQWRAAMHSPRKTDEIVINGCVGIVAHLAYHLGAMRQICAAMKGPKDGAVAA